MALIHKPKAIELSLTGPEFLQASMVGVMREIQNRRKGREDKYGAQPGEGWNYHIEGACGEMAVAKVIGLFWSGSLGLMSAADVGSLQVRTSAHIHDFLRLHPDDDDAAAYIHVSGLAPHFRIWGWLYAEDGKREELWGDKFKKDRPAFWVPVEELRPLGELKRAREFA